ncbi:hypothetical protein L1987_18936 [Smallanthus sonchifolius]|uniref:Uncharacterized protein n=1 Tax=Smallanthus sonchifolius TaxID=185202 RepID=A0ACB9J3A4_9ASTR|nr:hypothetical protein L1987_18936 [Smallanthus sonchifolius]
MDRLGFGSNGPKEAQILRTYQVCRKKGSAYLSSTHEVKSAYLPSAHEVKSAYLSSTHDQGPAHLLSAQASEWLSKVRQPRLAHQSAFLYGKVHEEVYVTQPPDFEDPHNINKVYNLDKALYGLHQAPRAWYETLSKHLLSNGFDRGQIDSTLFIRKAGGDILLVQVYVDDIIFGSTNEGMCREFEQVMKSKFEMSNMGELSFFLGLQVSQREDGIYLHQTKYVQDILSKYKMNDSSTYGTPIPVNHGLHPDKDGKDLHSENLENHWENLRCLEIVQIMARAFSNEFNLLANTEPEWKGAALQYRDIVDFLNRSRISYAISADPIVSRPYLEQFWETAEHDCTVSPNVIRATVAGQAIAFSEDTIRRVLQFRDLATDLTAYPDYFVDGCWRQRMG